MNVKKIAIVIIVLIFGAGGILYLRNYYQNKDKVVSDYDNFIADGKPLSKDWIKSIVEKKIKNGSQSGSVTYNFKSAITLDGKDYGQNVGTAYFRGAYDDKKIVLHGSGYETDKEIRENKGIIYYKNDQKDGKFLKIPITDNAGSAISNRFVDYDLDTLLVNAYNYAVVKDLGDDIINNEKTKIIQYSSNIIASNEEKYIKLWVSENNAVVLRAKIETRELPSDVVENGHISINFIEVMGYNFDKIPTAAFIPPAIEVDTSNIIKNNPNIFLDSDNDGLIDSVEKSLFKTDPNNPDTDGDGFKDGDEVDNGYNPLVAGQKGKIFNY